MAPAGDFTTITPFPKVRWTFEVRGGYSADINGFSDAWDVRRVNKGTMGWRARIAGDAVLTDAVQDDFYRKASTADTSIGPIKVTEPVYLDMNGQPLNLNIKVGYDLKDSIPNPTLITVNPLLRSYKLPSPGVPGGFIYVLLYKKFRAINFTGLI